MLVFEKRERDPWGWMYGNSHERGQGVKCEEAADYCDSSWLEDYEEGYFEDLERIKQDQDRFFGLPVEGLPEKAMSPSMVHIFAASHRRQLDPNREQVSENEWKEFVEQSVSVCVPDNGGMVDIESNMESDYDYPLSIKVVCGGKIDEIVAVSCNASTAERAIEYVARKLSIPVEGAFLERHSKPVRGNFKHHGFSKLIANQMHMHYPLLLGGMPKGFRGGKTVVNRRKKRNLRKREPVIRTLRLRELGVQDRVIQAYKYDELPTNRFNTVAAVDSIAYNMNSMRALFNGGSQAIIPYWNNGISESYNRYRVLKSKIVIKLTSREAVNSMTVCLAPMTPVVGSLAVPAIGSAADFTQMQSLPFAKTFTITPYVGGKANATLVGWMKPEKMVGKEYLVEADWGGLTDFASEPVNKIYWVLAFYNPSNNTLTTGGVLAQVTMIQTVEMYQPDRDDAPALALRDPDNPNTLRKKELDKSIEDEIDDVVAKVKSLKVRQ